MDAVSITDAIVHCAAINKKADELVSVRNHYIDLRMQANDEIYNRDIGKVEELDRALNAHEAEMLEKLNEATAYADELMANVENSCSLLMSRISGLFAEDNRAQYLSEARRNASARPLVAPANPVDMFEPLESTCRRLTRKIAQGSPSMFSAHDYYVDAFTLVEQARMYRPILQGQLEQLYRDWRSDADSQMNQMADNYQAEFEARVAEIDKDEDVFLDRWRIEWNALNDEYVGDNVAGLPDRSWPASPLESTLRIDVSGYAGNQDLEYLGIPHEDPLEQVDLDDSLVLWTSGQYRAAQVAEDQFWQAFDQVRHYDYRVSVCSGSGAIDQSPELIQLLKRLPEVSGGKVVTAPREIADLLRIMVAAMDDTLQNKLVGYRSVREFNDKNRMKPIPWRVLYVCHFPAGFDDASTRDLMNLVQQGPRAGIRVIVQGDDQGAPIDGYRTDGLGRNARALPQSVTFDAAADIWRSDVDRRLSVDLPSFNRVGLSESIERASAAFQQNKNKSIDLLSIVPRSRFQRCSSAHRLSLPIGIRDDGNPCVLEFGDVVGQGSSHFALVVGPTGSGKSVLLHSIIMSALISYPPSELQLYLLDFKEGTEFKAYTGIDLPQVRCVALDSMQQFGESVFAHLTAEMNRRADVFKRASAGGRQIASIAEYRDAGGSMPRILVVVDEFQELFDCERDRKCAMRAAARFAEIISKGRAFGIHMVFATQTLHHLFEGNYSIAKSSLEEMHVRIGLKCSEREYANLMGADVARLCVEKNDARKGSGVFTLDYVHDTPIGMRGAYLDPRRREKVLRQVEAACKGVQHTPAKVFRGNDDVFTPASTLGQVSAQRQRLFVGQPVALGKNVGMDVSPQSASNMLVLGEDRALLNRIATTLLCQGASPENGGSPVFLFDADAMHAVGGESPLLRSLQMAHAVSADADVRVAKNAFQVLPLLRDAYQMYVQRRNALAAGSVDTASLPPAYVFVLNYQQVDPIVRLMEGKSVADYDVEPEQTSGAAPADSLQAMLDSLAAELEEVSPSSNSDVPPQKMLRTLLESGHLCNFHCVLTCASSAVLGRLLRGDVAPFNYRIVLPHVADAYKYVETDINPRLVRSNCALYADGTGDAILVRPFVVAFSQGGKA